MLWLGYCSEEQIIRERKKEVNTPEHTGRVNAADVSIQATEKAVGSGTDGARRSVATKMNEQLLEM